MMEKFFLEVDGGSSVGRRITHPYQLISAASLWLGSTFRLPKISRDVQEIFLDSGGYSFLTKWGKYPFTDEEYVIFIERLKDAWPQVRYVATMDHPCTPGGKDNPTKIDQTLKNTQVLQDHLEARDLGVALVSVIQGYSIQEYMAAMDQMDDQGLWTPLTAIGSICQRSTLPEVREIIRACHSRRPAETSLHGFGLSLAHIRDRHIFGMIYSSDSGAWKFPEKGRPSGHEEQIINLEVYLQKVDRAFALHKGNKTLIEMGVA